MPSREAVMLMKKGAEAFGVSFGAPLIADERGLPHPKRAIRPQIETEQLGIDCPPSREDQPLRSRGIQIELDDGARDVPRRVLASDQIVRLVMVQRVGLQQAAIAKA